MSFGSSDSGTLESVAEEPLNDYSGSFVKIRGDLTNKQGVRLADFVRQLKPIYWRCWLDIAIGYAALIASLVLITIGQANGIPEALLAIVGSALVGLWLFYLVSFQHEGVHWNLAKSRKTNDLLCNVLLTWITGVNLIAYRRSHFEHHRALGTIDDTQTSYFYPLNSIAMLESLFGIRVVQAFWRYLTRSSTCQGRPLSESQPAFIRVITGPKWLGLIVGAAVHGLIVCALWLYLSAVAALAWLLGFCVIMPCFNTIRQILEHRHEDALADVDYSITDQGAYSRLFGTGLFDSTFGAAGANRHLLHHWEPQVSYTRLADLECFLTDTPMNAVMNHRRTTYLSALRELMSFR